MRRRELTESQEPFAIILGCSDSRVPAEIVFDQGLGDLFVIRVAGNIVAPSQVGSVEFAAERFNTRLVVVVGHPLWSDPGHSEELARPKRSRETFVPSSIVSGHLWSRCWTLSLGTTRMLWFGRRFGLTSGRLPTICDMAQKSLNS
jgi:hypothetical protein